MKRLSLADIATAALQRVQQALRVIEECLKLADASVASQIEAVRYQSYTLAKACITTAASRERLASSRLYVLIDGKKSECEFVEHVQALIAAGVDILQLRDKLLDDRTLLSRAILLRRVIDEAAREGEAPAEPLIIVNDRPDIAVLSRADGVHVGQEELPVHEVRQILGPDMLIGVSTHTIEQARQAVLDGANYLGCGPVFPTATKRFDHFPGLDFLRQVAADIAIPAFAIGGIDERNLAQVLETGFRRAAIGSAITSATDPKEMAHSLKEKLSAQG
jgi:thiamine-phosphate pyrophosphorylase